VRHVRVVGNLLAGDGVDHWLAHGRLHLLLHGHRLLHLLHLHGLSRVHRLLHLHGLLHGHGLHHHTGLYTLCGLHHHLSRLLHHHAGLLDHLHLATLRLVLAHVSGHHTHVRGCLRFTLTPIF